MYSMRPRRLDSQWLFVLLHPTHGRQEFNETSLSIILVQTVKSLNYTSDSSWWRSMAVQSAAPMTQRTKKWAKAQNPINTATTKWTPFSKIQLRQLHNSRHIGEFDKRRTTRFLHGALLMIYYYIGYFSQRKKEIALEQ